MGPVLLGFWFFVVTLGFFFFYMRFCSGGILVGSGQWWHGGGVVVVTGQWRCGDRG